MPLNLFMHQRLAINRAIQRPCDISRNPLRLQSAVIEIYIFKYLILL